jgi:site-specific DNA recombinase
MAERTVNKRLKIAALYARTSQDKDDSYQIASQILPMRDYAQRAGLVVAHEFREEFTGTKLDRPELNKLRALIQERQIDAVVIYRADRLSRMQHVAGYLLHEEFFPNNIELHVVTFGGPIRPGTRDVFVFNIESAIGQDERDLIIEKTQRGRRTKLTGGDGHPPAWVGHGHIDKYGYRRVGRRRNTSYEIVPEEAEVVRRIFTMFVHERKRMVDILRILNAEGITCPAKAKKHNIRTNTLWTSSGVYRMLREPMYKGIWYAGRKKKVKGKTLKQPFEECIRLDFPHLRIIDDETFQKAEELLIIGRSIHAPDPTNEYLMARRLRCMCGYAIGVNTQTRKSGKKHSYYCCTSRLRPEEKRCGLPYITAALLEDKVWQCIEQLLEDPKAQLEGLKRVQEEQLQGHAESIEHMRRAQETVQECERLLSVYSDQEAEGLISRQMLRTKKAELDKRIDAARKVQEEYAALLETKILTDEDISSLTQMFGHFRTRTGSGGHFLTFAEKRQVIDLLNITGSIAIEQIEGTAWCVLTLYLYTQELAKAVLVESKVLWSRRR